MTRIAVTVAVFGLALAGCEHQTSAPPPSTSKPGAKVDVEAPGVNVKVRGQQPDSTRRGPDVDVKVRKRGE